MQRNGIASFFVWLSHKYFKFTFSLRSPQKKKKTEVKKAEKKKKKKTVDKLPHNVAMAVLMVAFLYKC